MLIGLDAIGRVFGRSRWSVARWIRTAGFPAARLPDGNWCTTIGLIEAWLMARQRHDPLLQPAPEGREGE